MEIEVSNQKHNFTVWFEVEWDRAVSAAKFYILQDTGFNVNPNSLDHEFLYEFLKEVSREAVELSFNYSTSKIFNELKNHFNMCFCFGTAGIKLKSIKEFVLSSNDFEVTET